MLHSTMVFRGFVRRTTPELSDEVAKQVNGDGHLGFE